MSAQEAIPRELLSERKTLEQQVRALQERLAFYEGFDLLIQDNVTHARELFRRAAQERETALAATARARHVAGREEAFLRAELQTIAGDLGDVAQSVDALVRRVARALGESPGENDWRVPGTMQPHHAVAVVVHGVTSARTALSLQRVIAALPHVVVVSAREFAGGLLRLDARVRAPLHLSQFSPWEDGWRIQPLTERPDVLEFALHESDGMIA